MEAVRQRGRPGRADWQGRSAARQVLLDGTTVTKEDGTTEVRAKPEDIEKAARELHEIQERWKQVAEAPRAQAQTLWHRYRQAADPIQAKAREFFAQRAEERDANLKAKLALVERAEALAESTDWIKTADEMKKLQAEWQRSGRSPARTPRSSGSGSATRAIVSSRAETPTWRSARKSGRRTSRRRKRSARAPRSSRRRANGTRRRAEIRRLQAEWKTIGPVRRTKSEAMWQRFRTACDTFFERYKRRDEIEIEAKHADREALVVELETLATRRR